MTERMSTFFRLSLRALHSGLSVPYISCPMKRYSGLEGCGADSVCSAHPCADEHRPFRAACPNLAGHHRMLSGIRSYLSASGLREDFSLILLRWCNAVMQSEFAAALAYAINIYLVSRGVMRFPDIRASQTIMLLYMLLYLFHWA